MTTDVATVVAQVEDLVTRVASLTAADLSDDTADKAGLVFADTVGVVSAGARSAEMVVLARDPSLWLSNERTEVAKARTIGLGRRYGDAATVAWLNGTSGTFLELDEGFRPTGHPAIQVVPAALAVAESVGSSGADLATAVVAGYEVAARLFESFVLPRPMHPHGHFGAIGAATAVAMLTGTDAAALAHIAATQPLLTGWDACYAGATARNAWCGHANRVGVFAATLHRAGFTGSLASLLAVVAPYLVERQTITEPVSDATLRVRRNYFKFHSACALNHSTLDALLVAWDRLGRPDPLSVRSIEVTTVSANLRIARLPAPNALSTRFSLPYAVATALLTGSTAPEAFEWCEDVADYAKRVNVTADPAMEAAWPASAPARVRIRAGESIAVAAVDNPRGHASRPPTRADLRDKYVSLADDHQDAPDERFEALCRLAEYAECSKLPLP
jgi:2-methylcitrate dehydratase PrpD